MPATATRQRQTGPVYVVGSPAGLVVRGNLDLTKRPVVRNKDGSISTVKTTSWNVPVKVKGKIRNLEVLMPEVVGHRILSARGALNHFLSTGEHLGMFDSVAHANAYSIALHNWQANYYRKYLKRR